MMMMTMMREILNKIQIQQTTNLIENSLCLLILQHQLQEDPQESPENLTGCKSMRCQQVTTTPHQPEWLQRAAYLQNLMVSGSLALDKNQLSKLYFNCICSEFMSYNLCQMLHLSWNGADAIFSPGGECDRV